MAEQKRKPGRPPGSKNKNGGSGGKSASSAAEKKERVRLTAEQLAKKKRIKDEVWAIVLLALGAFLVISMQTDATGAMGHAIQTSFKGCFGFLAFILPYYLLLYGFLLFLRRTAHIGGRSVFFLILVYLMAAVLNSARFLKDVGAYEWNTDFIGELFRSGVELTGGGVFGMTVCLLLDGVIGVTGICILCGVAALISLMMVIDTPFSQFFDAWKLKRQAARQEQEEEDETIREAQALMAA
ncbi:MAG: DNA translocase FtsK 4TM domain-containing protein, partial [Bacillota bacterium]|nr:DNA translocase FtsK 4TM domain-containing protein [Bacillota bacterium]